MSDNLADGNASLSNGGGIYVVGTAIISNSQVINNSARNGGAIYNYQGPTTLTNSTVRGNSANDDGGIYNMHTATLNNSTLSANSANAGGGIYNYLGMATLTLTNSTLSGNSTGTGGGIHNIWDVRLLNVTLSNNSASSGGALYMASGHKTMLTNTIVAYSPEGDNCNVTIHTSRYSVPSDNFCAMAGVGNLNHVDPVLTALGNYGGPTLVHMLKLGSPAIDGVAGFDAPATDQRGIGFPRPQGGGFDMGAVERQPTDSDLAPGLYLPLIKRKVVVVPLR